MKKMLNTRILIVGHGAGLVGGDRYMFDQAILLSKNQYHVECIAFETGQLENLYKQNEIPFSVHTIASMDNKKIRSLIEDFDVVIANTIYTIFFAYIAQKYKPTMLILHDCLSYMNNIINRVPLTYKELKRIRYVYGVSEYHANILKRIGLKNVQVLNNFVTDEYNPSCSNENNIKVKFLTVANWNIVKGYDLALKALKNLSQKEKEQIEWHIVGKMEEEDKCKKFRDEIAKEKWIVTHGVIEDKKKLHDLYIRSDVYLHMSREDACPLAVVDAAMLQKPLIVSKDTGANYLTKKGAGWIVDEYDCRSILIAIREAIKYKNKLVDMGKVARKNYLENATSEVYIQSLVQSFNHIIQKDIVDKVKKYNGIFNDKNSSNLKIALYGYNIYTQIEQFYINKYRNYELIGIYDRAYEKFQNQGINIKNPSDLNNKDIDYVCIYCVYESNIQSIMHYLIEREIPKEKIKIGTKFVVELMETRKLK